MTSPTSTGKPGDPTDSKAPTPPPYMPHMARRQTFKLSKAKWQELESHLNAANEAIQDAQPLDPSKLTEGLGLPAITYQGHVFAIDPDELEAQP